MLHTSPDVLIDTAPSAGTAALLEALLALAARVINDHTNDNGLCAVCGSAFPCQSAVLAEHNLALSSAP